ARPSPASGPHANRPPQLPAAGQRSGQAQTERAEADRLTDTGAGPHDKHLLHIGSRVAECSPRSWACCRSTYASADPFAVAARAAPSVPYQSVLMPVGTWVASHGVPVSSMRS